MYTEFPLGLFHAWSYLQFDTACLVYPRPITTHPLPVHSGPDEAGLIAVAGDEDFSGLRNYVPGDALPHVAWKVWARGQGLQVKQFSDLAGLQLWLDWNHLPQLAGESRLAVLTYWVLQAHAQNIRYGLRLPDAEVPPGNGLSHRSACLKALALSGLPADKISPA